MRLNLLLLLPGLGLTQVLAGDIYTCVENGVTKFSQTPCGPTPSQSQIYHPNAPAMELTTPVKSLNIVAQPLNHEVIPTHTAASVHPAKQLKVSAERCESKGLNGYYSGVVKNSSRTATMEAKLEVTFDFEKNSRVKSAWDQKSRLFRLKPGQTQAFELESRLLPPASKVQCHAVWQVLLQG